MGILKVENLTKIYGKDEAKVVALNDVSLEIDEGEFIVITYYGRFRATNRRKSIFL